jgi:ribosomal protein S18 acetylase RimI-like enzyme
MTIRDLAWNDFPAWAELYFTRFDEVRTNPELGVFTTEKRPSLADEAAFFAQVWGRILSGAAVVSVAEVDGKIVGICAIHRTGDHVEDRHVGGLGVAIHPEHRGRGLGEQLLQHALEKCRGRFEIVQLSVISVNHAAIRLYKKLGFEGCGTLPRAFRRGDRYFDQLLMSKPVEAGHVEGTRAKRTRKSRNP